LSLRPMLSRQHVRLAAIALAVAGVFTLPSFWVALVRFNPEQYYFVPALAFCHLAALDARGAIGVRSSWIALGAIALLAPVFAPFAILSWLVMWSVAPDSGREDWSTIARLTVLAITAIAMFALPALLARLTTYTLVDGGIGFRSGLDGSQEHFTSMLQAVFAPSYPPGRAWFVWPWPVAALVAIGVAAVQAPALAAGMLRQLFVCWLPFLWMVVCFPQLVSIHPYQFDFHLCLGAALSVVLWLQRPDLQGWTTAPAARLAILIALTGLLMTNLIDLARMRVVP
jgi:hypothetical protein